MLQADLAWHAAQLRAAWGQTMVYRRETTELQVIAVEGKTEYEATTNDQTRVRGQRTDWICGRAELAGLYPPRSGDQIQSGSTVYEVQNLGDEPCYRDMSEDLVRIHVRLL